MSIGMKVPKRKGDLMKIRIAGVVNTESLVEVIDNKNELEARKEARNEKFRPTRKVREERDHTDRNHSRRNARGEKRRSI